MRLMAKVPQLQFSGRELTHGQQMADVRRNAPGDAHAQLDEGRRIEQPLLDHLLDEPQVAGVEHLQSGFTPRSRAIAAP